MRDPAGLQGMGCAAKTSAAPSAAPRCSGRASATGRYGRRRNSGNPTNGRFGMPSKQDTDNVVNVERWGWYSIAVSVLLAFLHGFVAAASGSLAVTAELVHNLVDQLAAAGVAGMIFLSAWEIVREALLAPPAPVRADGWLAGCSPCWWRRRPFPSSSATLSCAPARAALHEVLAPCLAKPGHSKECQRLRHESTPRRRGSRAPLPRHGRGTKASAKQECRAPLPDRPTRPRCGSTTRRFQSSRARAKPSGVAGTGVCKVPACRETRRGRRGTRLSMPGEKPAVWRIVRAYPLKSLSAA
jgi:hypothetical protein